MDIDKKKRAKRKIAPVHTVDVRAFSFPIDTTDRQSNKLFSHCAIYCSVNNILTGEREANRELIRQQKAAGLPEDAYITRADQYKQLTVMTKANPLLKTVHSQVLQNVAQKIDKGTQDWLSHLAKGNAGKKSPPGYSELRDYKSFCFPQYGAAAYIKSGLLHLSKIGDLRLRDYRKLPGEPKTITIKFKDGRWFAIISCEIRPSELYRGADEVKNLPDLGGDTGLSALLTLSDGSVFDPPKALKLALSKLRSAQKDMSRKFESRKTAYADESARRKAAGEPAQAPLREIPHSKRLKNQIKVVAKLHTKIANTRSHHHKKIARRLENVVRFLAVEEHGVQFMIRNRRLALAASDRAVAAFKGALKSAFGMRYVPVGTSRPGIGGNSQTCLCNAQVPKTLNERTHTCTNCGLTAPRDVVSANIVSKTAFGSSILLVPDASKILVVKTKAAPAAGLVVTGRKTKLRGEIEGASLDLSPVTSRVPGNGTLEISAKRKPVLPKGSEIVGEKSAAIVKTSCVLKMQKSAALPRETNTQIQSRVVDPGFQDPIVMAGDRSSGSGKHRLS